MKKCFFAVCLMLLCSTAFSQNRPQITNGDFETWTYDGANLPNNFNSFQTADGKYAGTAYSSSNRQVQRSTDTRPGSAGKYSCKIWARRVKFLWIDVVAQGNLTTGRIHAQGTSPTAGDDNYNFTGRDQFTTGPTNVSNPCFMKFTGRPDSLAVWVKFNPSGNDTSHPYAMVSAYLHDDNDFIRGYQFLGYQSNIVGSNEVQIKSTGGKWKRISMPFKYASSTAPSYILLSFFTNAYPGGGNDGDALFIDDIQMIYNSSYELSIASKNGWASVCLDFAAKIPEDATAYYATEMVAGYVKLKAIPAGKTIAANTPVLIRSSKTTLTLKSSYDDPVSTEGNILSGVLKSTSTESGYKYYVLSGDATSGSRAAFGEFNGSTLSANKAFIKVKE